MLNAAILLVILFIWETQFNVWDLTILCHLWRFHNLLLDQFLLADAGGYVWVAWRCWIRLQAVELLAMVPEVRLVCVHRALWQTVPMTHSSRPIGVTSSIMLNIVRVSALVNPGPCGAAQAKFRTALNWRSVMSVICRGEAAALGDTEFCVTVMSAAASVLAPAVDGKSAGDAGAVGATGAAVAADMRTRPGSRDARRDDMAGVVKRCALHGKPHFPIFSVILLAHVVLSTRNGLHSWYLVDWIQLYSPGRKWPRRGSGSSYCLSSNLLDVLGTATWCGCKA